MRPFPSVRIIVLFVATFAMFASGARARKKPKTPHCAGGYYQIDGASLLPGITGADVLVIGNGQVSTASGCTATKPVMFHPKAGRAGGDVLVARWPTCGTVRKALLHAKISADCSSVTGTFKAKGSKRRSFTAHDALPSQLHEPWDPSTAPIPPGAEILRPTDFIDVANGPDFHLISPRLMAADDQAAADDDEANKATLAAFVAAHPERASFASIGVDPADPDLIQTSDGNYALTIHDIDGNPKSIVTMGPRAQRSVRARTIRTYPTQQNQLAIYALRYAVAHTINPSLPAPADVVNMSAEDLASLNHDVGMQEPAAEFSQTLPAEEVPSSYPGRCGLEIGAGDGTDGSGYCKHTADGLWNNATWPLKFYDRCVKSQANRGTCVAFAVTAGREMRIAQKYGRWINLSEQHLYFAAKQVFQPVNYGDGLDGSGLLQQLRDANYQQPLEQAWDYNPANSRTADNATKTYFSSCVGYGGDEKAYCSDTAGEGRVVCMQNGSNYVCAAVGIPNLGTTVRSIEQPAELWDAGNPDDSLVNTLYAAAVLRTPVVLGFDVVRSFDSPDKNGYVTFHPTAAKVCDTDPKDNSCKAAPDCECSRGGHAALAVGYINNAKLPEAAPKGAGGGYVIIKNSWGCAGDGGYYFVPIDWAKAFFYSARPVGDVEVSSPLPDQPIDNFHFDYHPAPPSIHIVQPTLYDSFVAGQGVPLSLDGADFQYPDYALLGPTVWTSDLQGTLATGTNAVTTLIQGTHHITATYTGKTGTIVTARSTTIVGTMPADLPPTPYFVDLITLPAAQCPQACSFSCVIGYGHGVDPEDGVLSSNAQVKWYEQPPNGTEELVATGADTPQAGKFLGCARLCGGTFRFTLQVVDHLGQHAEARREISTAGCIN